MTQNKDKENKKQVLLTKFVNVAKKEGITVGFFLLDLKVLPYLLKNC